MKLRQKIVFMLSVLCFMASAAAFAVSSSDAAHKTVLSAEESKYISGRPVIRVGSIDGVAPLAYFKNGEMLGISRSILDKIAGETGFTFKYIAARDVNMIIELVQKGEIDIIASIPKQYLGKILSKYPLSKPFLYSEAILFIRNDLDASDLSDLTFASITAGKLPSGVAPDKVKYYSNREETLNAVDSGKADYCYANEFSVAYYTVKNGYNHSASVPQGKESREYAFLYANTDKTFISIIDKALSTISPMDMQHIILRNTSQVERKATLDMVLHSYGSQIALITAAVVLLLILLSTMSFMFAKLSRKQLRRLLLLADVSDEFIYDYDASKDTMSLTQKCSELLHMPVLNPGYKKNGGFRAFAVLEGLDITESDMREVEIGGKTFRIVNSAIMDNRGKPEFIIGKLVDISAEKEKLNDLQQKVETDGLTGIYNATTARNLIKNRYEQYAGAGSALMIMDIDRFKSVNDTYGHYIGDAVLRNVAASLTEIFRDSDIVGRLGGDEFGVYMCSAVSESIIQRKYAALCKRINDLQEHSGCPSVTISVGVLICDDADMSFEDAYKHADAALYEAKHCGRNCYKIQKASLADE